MERLGLPRLWDLYVCQRRPVRTKDVTSWRSSLFPILVPLLFFPSFLISFALPPRPPRPLPRISLLSLLSLLPLLLLLLGLFLPLRLLSLLSASSSPSIPSPLPPSFPSPSFLTIPPPPHLPAERACGFRYGGSWKQGKKHGIGTYYFQSGAKYQGEYKEGEPHGNAVFFEADGRAFEEVPPPTHKRMLVLSRSRGDWLRSGMVQRQEAEAQACHANPILQRCAIAS